MHYLFSTVRDARLRRLLSADYRELRVALGNGMHKASLVLCGSIIEAVLTDYLQVLRYKKSTDGKAPQDMLLDELIEASKAEGALAPGTLHLCAAVKNYRNLIHPGRIVREDEWPSEARAKMAAEAVEQVAGDVAKRLRALPEWAADGIVASADDPFTSWSALARQVARLPEADAERMVLELLPDRLREVNSPVDDEGYLAPVGGYRVCYGAALKRISPAAMTVAAEKLLKEVEASTPFDDEKWVEAFFFPELLGGLGGPERRSLSHGVATRLSGLFKRGVFLPIDGIGAQLDEAGVRVLVQALARASLSDNKEAQEYARGAMVAEATTMQEDSRRIALQVLEGLVVKCESAEKPEAAASLAGLRYEIEEPRDEDLLR